MLIALLALTLPFDADGQNSVRGQASSAQAPRGTSRNWRSTARDDSEPADSKRERTAVTAPASDESATDEDHAPPPRRAVPPTAREPSGFSDPSFIKAGQLWRDYNLSPYTSRLNEVAHPEQSVVDWILKQTGPETWHGEDPAVLSASRGRLRVFHRQDVQNDIAEIVERFTRPVQPQVSMRVQLITTADLNWRNGLVHLMKPVAVGPDGQHVWLVAPEDLALIRNRLKLDRQPGLVNQRVLANNGQPTTIETGQTVNYISGLDLQSGIYVAYQPIIARLTEGVKATLTPLWTADGSAVDLEVQVTTRHVTKLHYAQSAAPLRSGSQETVVQVPEVSATSLDQTLNWPVSQILLISTGVHPTKGTGGRGPLSFSSAAAEILILAELDSPVSARAASRRGAPVGR
jgi:hypothetical protein